mgnify:FL=1
MPIFGSYDVLTRFVRDTTFGSIPSNPVWAWIDSGVQMMQPTESKSRMEIYSLDQRRDPRFSLYMERAFDYKIRYYPSNISFLTYGITSANTSISIEEYWNPQVGGTAQYYRFLGAQCNEEQITWNVGQPLQVDMTFVHKDVPALFPDTNIVAGATNAAEPTAQPFLFSDTFITLQSSGAIGYQNINILSATVTIRNKIDRRSGYSIGQDSVTALPLGRREVDVSITRMFEDLNQVAQWTATQGTPVQIKFPLGSSNTLTINNLKWDPIDLPKDVNRDILVYTFTGKAYEPTAGGASITLA